MKFQKGEKSSLDLNRKLDPDLPFASSESDTSP